MTVVFPSAENWKVTLHSEEIAFPSQQTAGPVTQILERAAMASRR